MTCPCGDCNRRTDSPAFDGWVQVTNWGAIRADDTRPDSEVTEWFASLRCLWKAGERRHLADLGAAVSAEANERIRGAA